MPQTESKERSEFANRVLAARSALNLTQPEAAERWGIKLRTLQHWEQGTATPRGFALTQFDKLLAETLDGAPVAVTPPPKRRGRPSHPRSG